MTMYAWIHTVIFIIICSEVTMVCGCTFNIPFWRWVKLRKKYSHYIRCYDYTELYMEDLETKDFHQCNG